MKITDYLTACIVDNSMIAMGSLRKKEVNVQINTELFRLSKGFKALTIDHQKWVLKTALGLLRIQRACRTMTTEKTSHVPLKNKNG